MYASYGCIRLNSEPPNKIQTNIINSNCTFVNILCYSSTPSATLERNASLIGSNETWKNSQLQNNSGSLNRSLQRGDDEHGLIARYAAKLAQGQQESRPTSEQESSSSAHQLLAQLENKNQEILREIARIRYCSTFHIFFKFLNTYYMYIYHR